MKFKDIPQITRDGNYRIDAGWDYLESFLFRKGRVANINPDFQRHIVWSTLQQSRFVEFILRGGKGCNLLRFNCPGWMHDFRGPFEIVDGKQRLTSVLEFMNNRLTVFDGLYFRDFTDRLPSHASFSIMVNDLSNRRDVLQWYLDINSGGVAHTKEDLDKVKKLLDNSAP